jgi:hypothetical protein
MGMIPRKPLPDHLFVGDEGQLFDTRIDNWHIQTPQRWDYHKHHQTIQTVAHLKATLRAGSYAWPGGYPLYFITTDGGALSFETVRDEFSNVVWSVKNQANDGWQVCACDVNWEDADLIDDHTGEYIESALR